MLTKMLERFMSVLIIINSPKIIIPKLLKSRRTILGFGRRSAVLNMKDMQTSTLPSSALRLL